jgi:hypothetical protein
MERTESAGITTVFREHYKQLGSTGVRRVRRGQLRPRDSGAGLVASQSTKRNAKYDEPFTKKRWNAQSRTCRHTKLATLLT